jgi:hypothetical protein
MYGLCSILLILIILFSVSKKVFEAFVPYNPAVDFVETSGMDTLTPLPYYLKYSYPNYWYNYVSPTIFYDIPFYGPIAKPWGRQSREKIIYFY